MSHCTRLHIARLDVELRGDLRATQMFRRRYQSFLTASHQARPRATIDFESVGQAGESWVGEPMHLRPTDRGVELSSEGFWAEMDPVTCHATVRAPLADRAIDGVLRYLLAQRLLDEGALLLHASAVIRESGAWLFAGPSGAGKSTLARNLRGILLGDEAIALRLEGTRLVAYATPYWKSEQHSARLAGLFFIGQGAANSVVELGSARAVAGLVKNAGPILPGSESSCMRSAHALVSAMPLPARQLTVSSIASIGTWLQDMLAAEAMAGLGG